MRGWGIERMGPKNHIFMLELLHPDGQGKGYCKEVMQLLVVAADKCHMECYLETQEKNRPYYEKFGYKSVAKNDLFIEGRDGSDDIRLPGHVLV